MTFIWCHGAHLLFYLFFPSSPFSRPLSLSITCHAPAISLWPFSQTDGSCTNCAISTHVILFVQTDPLLFFFLSEMYLFNKWIFNLPVIDSFFLRVDVKKIAPRETNRCCERVPVLFCSLVSELLMFMLKFKTKASQEEKFFVNKIQFLWNFIHPLQICTENTIVDCPTCQIYSFVITKTTFLLFTKKHLCCNMCCSVI